MLAAARYGSASKAAAQLHVSQPAITSAIASLEKRLGTALFIRTSKGMSLTTEGATVAERAESALSHIDAIENQLKARAKIKSVPLRRQISETQFSAFLSLVETGSYSGAAERLSISQPAISRSIHDLEGLLGEALWVRSGGSGEPTAFGRTVARRAGVCMRELELAVEEIKNGQGARGGALKIGALPLSRSEWVPASIIGTLKTYPNAEVSVMDGPYLDQISALTHGRIDLIVGALRPAPDPTTIVQRRIFDDALAIVVRADHPFLTEAPRTPECDIRWLKHQTWVLPARGTPGRDTFLAYLADRGLPPPPKVIECGSLIAMRALLLQSDFAAPISLRQIELELRLGVLGVAFAELPGTSRAIGIAHRKGFSPTGLYKEFVDQLVASAHL